MQPEYGYRTAMKPCCKVVVATLICSGLVCMGGCTESSKEPERRAGTQVVPAEVESAYQRGLDYRMGSNGHERSAAKAAEWLQRAADRGHADAQYQLAGLYRGGLSGPGDLSASEKYYALAAMQEHAEAQMALAELYRLQDSEKYLYWMQRSAEQGNAQAQLLLAHAYGRGEVLKPPRYATAFYWYNKAASNGNADASYWLGWSYLKGEGIPVNLDLAKYWFRQSTDPRAAEELAKLR